MAGFLFLVLVDAWHAWLVDMTLVGMIMMVQVDNGQTYTEPSAIMSGDVENREQVWINVMLRVSLLYYMTD